MLSSAAALPGLLRYHLRASGMRWYVMGLPPLALLCSIPYLDFSGRLGIATVIAVMGMILPASLSRINPTLMSTLPVHPAWIRGSRWLVMLALAAMHAVPLLLMTALSRDGDPAARQLAMATVTWVAAFIPMGCLLCGLLVDLVQRWLATMAIGMMMVMSISFAAPMLRSGIVNSHIGGFLSPLGLLIAGLAAGTLYVCVVEPRLMGSATGPRSPAASGHDAPANAPARTAKRDGASGPKRWISPSLRLLLLAICSSWRFPVLNLAIAINVACLVRSPVNGFSWYPPLFIAFMGLHVLKETRARMLGGRIPVYPAYVSTLLTGPSLIGLVALLALIAPLPDKVYPSHELLQNSASEYLSEAFRGAKRFRLPDGRILSRDEYVRTPEQSRSRLDAPFLCEQLARLCARDEHLPVSAADCQIPSWHDASDKRFIVELRPGLMEAIRIFRRQERALMVMVGITLSFLMISLIMPTARGRSIRSVIGLGPMARWISVWIAIAVGFGLILHPWPTTIDIPAPDQVPEVRLSGWDRAQIAFFGHGAAVACVCVALSALLVADQLRRLRHLALEP